MEEETKAIEEGNREEMNNGKNENGEEIEAGTGDGKQEGKKLKNHIDTDDKDQNKDESQAIELAGYKKKENQNEEQEGREKGGATLEQDRANATEAEIPPPKGTIRRTSINRAAQSKPETQRSDLIEFKMIVEIAKENIEMTYDAVLINGLNDKMSKEKFVKVVLGTIRGAGIGDTQNEEQEKKWLK